MGREDEVMIKLQEKVIEELQDEIKQLKKDYSLLEECSPPDWPREAFVLRHLFDLWGKG